MRNVKSIIYRYLTNADFFNMYKLQGTEIGGGGQLYIDFLTSQIPVENWREFFSGIRNVQETQVKNGPQWEFQIKSVGIRDESPRQILRIYQRRPASICIPNQNTNTRSANRVAAWSPAFGFPEPSNPNSRNSLPLGLVVFFVSTYEGEVWAGWYQNTGPNRVPCQNEASVGLISELINSEHHQGDVGILQFQRRVLFLEEANATSPFTTATNEIQTTTDQQTAPTHGIRRTRERGARTTTPPQYRPRTDEQILISLFGEDQQPPQEQTERSRQITVRVRHRNQNAVNDLKQLYRHQCQISGSRFTFLKRDGTPYTEAHHLIPLGRGGADDPRNMIIVSPLVHRMLHYANITELDLSSIVQHQDGSATLTFQINGEENTVTWHAEHANRIRRWENPIR